MQLGIIGLGRMGSSTAARLSAAGHQVVAFDRDEQRVRAWAARGAAAAYSLQELAAKLQAPRAVWLMLPAAAVDPIVGALRPLLVPGDVVIDGGNSYYPDDIRRAAQLALGEADFADRVLSAMRFHFGGHAER